MTIGFICVLIAGLLPIIWAGYAKLALPGGFKGRYNKNPREILSKAQGKSQRSNWAQQNSWEAFAPFAAAVIIAHYLKVDQSMIDCSSVIFIIARILYGIFYIFNKDSLRSIVWFVGLAAVLNLYIQAW